jgi:TolB-like protein/Tfp pilus assembly protein PilF
MIGRVLGHYRILERIGAGGMGEVYRARDGRLDRDVALKVLPADRLSDETVRRRFRKEAHALSRLSHPHVATVHDFDTQDGIDFLVMELVPGRSLDELLRSGPLPEKEVLRLGAQLARGLMAAHEHGVVHRDLKPSNIRLTKDGGLKILDFGLARVEAPAGERSGPTATLEPVFAGTVPYMAPEQIRGLSVDARTDVYAAGNVLYEMVTGERPFAGSHGPMLTEAILHQAPASPRERQPALSSGLEFVILKALEKEPERRYQSAKDLLLDLERLAVPSVATVPPERVRRRRWPWVAAAAAALAFAFVGIVAWRALGTARAAPIASLAVLPLQNFSGDPGQEFFVDGMTDALIAGLAQIKAVKVISRTSIMQYKDARKPLPEIARELGVEGVVEGSVVRSGNRVRVTTQLIDARQDRHVWASSYEREMTDVLSLQSEVVQAIAEEIRAQVSPGERERLETARKVDPRSYEAYLEGRFFWNKSTAPSMEKSIEYFRQAIALDPRNAPAYVGLAEAYSVLGQMAGLPMTEVGPRQREAALRALEIDDTLAEAHAALASVKQDVEWDWPGAEREYRRAIELSPSSANSHLWYSQFLNWLGRHEESLASVTRARELDPLNPFIAVNTLFRLYYLGRYDEAIAQSRKLLEIHRDYWLNHWARGFLYSAKGMHQEAIAEQEKAVALSEGSLECLPWLGYAYARGGRTTDAREVLARLERESRKRYVPSILFAPVYVGLGEKNRAFEFLERGYAERDMRLVWLVGDPLFEPLRSDPRMQDIRRRMRLPDQSRFKT